LFYRLSVLPVEIPPLRERREDIPKLALRFVSQSAQRLNRPAPRVSQAALSRLAARDWPGNVRELQNVIERAVILWQGVHCGSKPNRPLNPRVPCSLPAQLINACSHVTN
jgi:DNA-binding NtrC family response regulator